jgi:hypothetical protein
MQKHLTVELLKDNNPTGVFEKVTEQTARMMISDRRARLVVVPVKLKSVYGVFNPGESVGLPSDVARDLIARNLAVAEDKADPSVRDAAPALPESLAGINTREAGEMIAEQTDLETVLDWYEAEKRKGVRRLLEDRIFELQSEEADEE